MGFVSTAGKWWRASELRRRKGNGAVEKTPVVVNLEAAVAIIGGYGRWKEARRVLMER